MRFEDAFSQLDELYDSDNMIVNRWLYIQDTEAYYVVWADRWGCLRIFADQVHDTDRLYNLLQCMGTTPGPFPYVAENPEFWHVETPCSFLDYLRKHLTKKGTFKKCI